MIDSASAGVRSVGRPVRLGWITEHVELLRALLRRELRAKYKGSVLGVLWSYLHPVFMMAVYTLVFSVLWKAVSIPHYPLFVLAGLAVWTFFQAAIHTGAGSLVANAPLITKVRFAREVITVAAVLGQAVTALVMLAVLIPINLVFVPETARTVLLALPVFAALVCLALGFALALATANVFFRDVEHLLGVLLLPWFFLTPIFYSLDQLPGAAEHPWLVELLRYANPVTPYVETLRGAILQADVAGPEMLAYVFVVGPALALLGLLVFQRYEDRFAVEL